MSHTVTVAVGVDGSPESLAAADWAAREAVLRAAVLRVVHAGEQQPHAYVPFAGEAVPAPGADLSARMLREVAAALRHRHPGLRITAEQVDGQPTRVLRAAAEEGELLVLGSRGLGPAAGFLLGSVSSAVVARVERPVVLVRPSAGVTAQHGADASETAPYREIVLGLDLNNPHDAVLGFAFGAASRRGADLRVVHGCSRPAYPVDVAGAPEERPGSEPPELLRVMLIDTLRPWREKFPDVEVADEAVVGQAGSHLADASRNASLVVVGRKSRHALLGPHIGPVTNAVLHHSAAPVAVVPHD
ncbi:universal stress protein [Streptomyces ipomoeae]|uniref:Universal stress protein n=1 Tax=Streptomyces ipomoeae TaxID=103232 RepID=A0AAE9AZQ0_9ACTN|nr:universal stress protein [Streptomyces ipomoeae]TQE33304.1 universal stress protein [Streptomyces ipomoeae]TQE39568.1 universal stress protein [Streptomyces ipomoeae]